MKVEQRRTYLNGSGVRLQVYVWYGMVWYGMVDVFDHEGYLAAEASVSSFGWGQCH